MSQQKSFRKIPFITPVENIKTQEEVKNFLVENGFQVSGQFDVFDSAKDAVDVDDDVAGLTE